MDHAIAALAMLLLLSAKSVSGDCILYTEKQTPQECIGLYECSGSIENLRETYRLWGCPNSNPAKSCNYYPCVVTPVRVYLKIKILNASYRTRYMENMGRLIYNVVKMTVTNGDMTFIPNELFNMDKLSELDVSHNKIESIDLSKSLEQGELRVFNASFNLAAQLETSKYDRVISNLAVIDLSYNAIKIVPDNYFHKLPHLLHLNMSHNLINSFNLLTFEGLSQLETLYLSNNHIQRIEMTLSRFSNLKELTLDHNNLSSIEENNFKMLSSLIMLDLSFNKIISIDEFSFLNMGTLINLRLNDNNIKVITKSMFMNNDALRQVDFSNNLIQQIDPFSFKETYITICNFRNNALATLDDKSIFVGIHVKELDLSISNITSLSEYVFVEIHSELQKLNLSTNSISHIHESSFRELKLLRELDLSNNKLQNIEFNMRNLTNLYYFNVKNNLITKITKDTFRNLKALKEIDLTGNAIVEIETFSFNDLEKVQNLDLSNNNLLSIAPHTFHGLSTTQQLELMHSKITILQDSAFYGMMALYNLNASYNDIQVLSYNIFNGTKNIWSLDLSHNRLKTFHINNNYLKNVEKIYLNDNKIESLTNVTFDGINNLLELELDHNNILQISINAFSNLYKISSLCLSSNVDMMLDTSVFTNISTLIYIGLHDVWKPFNFKNAKNISITSIDLSSSNITDINSVMVYKLMTLETLLLNSNKIRYIDRHSFQNLSSLISLDLSDNMISTIKPGSFADTREISFLNLHNNNLVSLTYGVFDGLANLRILNLSSNSLQGFQGRIFHNSHRLSVISLDDNMINNIDLIELNASNIPKVTIGGNMIPCDVLALWKKNYFYGVTVTSDQINVHVENVDGISCKSLQIETSTDYEQIISGDKAELVKITDVGRVDVGSSTFQIINNQLDTLKSALYFEASCLFLIVCLLFGVISFVYIKFRNNFVRTYSVSSRRYFADIEMES